MPPSAKPRRHTTRYLFVGALCALGALAPRCGLPPDLGGNTRRRRHRDRAQRHRRRIYGAAVTSAGDAVLVRCLPWLESGPYFLLIGLPLLSLGAIGSSSTPGYPVWLRFDGGLLLAVAILCAIITIRNWRTICRP